MTGRTNVATQMVDEELQTRMSLKKAKRCTYYEAMMTADPCKPHRKASVWTASRRLALRQEWWSAKGTKARPVPDRRWLTPSSAETRSGDSSSRPSQFPQCLNTEDPFPAASGGLYIKASHRPADGFWTVFEMNGAQGRPITGPLGSIMHGTQWIRSTGLHIRGLWR